MSASRSARESTRFACSPCSNFMISGLQDVEKCRQQLHEINVPLEVFE